jgi:hypothetical protein
MTGTTEPAFLDVNEAAVIKLFSEGITGEITMLNLLRFRETADYSGFPDIAPEIPITGRQAYQRYIEHTLPFLTASGGRLDYLGDGYDYLVGPPDTGWDMAMLVVQKSLEDFIAFSTNEGYLAGIGHRTAALRDSRILPLIEQTTTDPRSS